MSEPNVDQNIEYYSTQQQRKSEVSDNKMNLKTMTKDVLSDKLFKKQAKSYVIDKNRKLLKITVRNGIKIVEGDKETYNKI